jgi:uncharacterized protein (TIGR02246 family)
MKHLWTGAVLASLFVLAGCPERDRTDAPALRAEATAEDRQAVEQLARDYEEAWARNDAAGAAQIYLEDGAHRGPDGRLGSGRAEIARVLEEGFAGPFKDSRIRLTQEETRFPTADVAAGRGSFQIEGGQAMEGGQARPAETGYYMIVAVRRDGQWRLLESQSYFPTQAPQQTD